MSSTEISAAFSVPRSKNKRTPGQIQAAIDRCHFLPLRRVACYKTSMATTLNIGFLGAGKMATALASGFIIAETRRPPGNHRQRPVRRRAKTFRRRNRRENRSRPTPKSRNSPNVLILATKPDQVPAALAEISGAFTEKSSAHLHRRRRDAGETRSRAARRRARHPRHAQHAGARRRRRVGVRARQIRDRGGRRAGEKTSCPPSASRFR